MQNFRMYQAMCRCCNHNWLDGSLMFPIRICIASGRHATWLLSMCCNKSPVPAAGCCPPSRLPRRTRGSPPPGAAPSPPRPPPAAGSCVPRTPCAGGPPNPSAGSSPSVAFHPNQGDIQRQKSICSVVSLFCKIRLIFSTFSSLCGLAYSPGLSALSSEWRTCAFYLHCFCTTASTVPRIPIRKAEMFKQARFDYSWRLPPSAKLEST